MYRLCAAGAFWLGMLTAAGEAVTQELMLRLTTPLSTMKKAGARFEGVVTGCRRADCATPLPEGSTIRGHVERVQPVRFGVRRERASMVLAFDGCHLPDGSVRACRTELLSVDNARETVSGGNRIHGILAANHPHAYLGGLWTRPTSALLSRSVSGITGAGRMIYRGLSPHPVVGGTLIAARLLLTRMPDPEIYVPAGTDLLVRVTGEAPESRAEPGSYAAPAPVASWLAAAPAQVTLPDGSLAADVVNVVLGGTRSEVEAAFEGAGWTTADPLTGRTFARSYRAFTSMEPYPKAPVSPLRYEGRLPDLVFQKSYNSMAKRHHIRLWKVESSEGTLWLGAATHDIAIIFDWKRLAMTHKIDAEIDRERDKVYADLAYAGCLSETVRIERPELAGKTPRAVTDGALYLLRPRACQQAPMPGADAFRRPRANLAKAIVRRAMLESRHYLVRGNAYYWAYKGFMSKAMLGRFKGSKAVLASAGPEAGRTGWRRGSESNRRMRALQTLALPLGYRAPE